MARWMARGGAGLAAAAMIWILIAIGLDRCADRPSRRGWDAIVVLGCNVRDDGVPGAALERRVRHAVALWRAGVAPRIVLTGGVGEGKSTSEARAASRLARTLGVPWEAMVLEERSTSTEENARFARAALGRGRVVVVSDAYHVTRGERVFARHFEEVATAGVRGAPLAGAMREVAALAIYALLGRLDDPRVPTAEWLPRRALLAELSAARPRRRGRGAPHARPRPRACGAARRRAPRPAPPPRRTHGPPSPAGR